MTVGTRGDWIVQGDGVLETHLQVAFDGRRLYVAAAAPGAPVTLCGVPIDDGWWMVDLPAELQLGEVRIAASSEPYADKVHTLVPAGVDGATWPVTGVAARRTSGTWPVEGLVDTLDASLSEPRQDSNGLDTDIPDTLRVIAPETPRISPSPSETAVSPPPRDARPTADGSNTEKPRVPALGDAIVSPENRPTPAPSIPPESGVRAIRTVSVEQALTWATVAVAGVAFAIVLAVGVALYRLW